MVKITIKMNRTKHYKIVFVECDTVELRNTTHKTICVFEPREDHHISNVKNIEEYSIGNIKQCVITV